MQDQDLGFATEKIIWTGTGSFTNEKRMDLLSRLERYPEVKIACLSNPVPGYYPEKNGAPIDDPTSIFHGMSIDFWGASPEFFDVYDLEFIQGEEIVDQISMRTYSRDSSESSSAEYFIINETLMNALDLEDPVGYQFSSNRYIMGVIKDFHFQSLRYPIKPMLLELELDGNGWWLSMKINSPNLNRTLRQINKEYNEAGKNDLDLTRPAGISLAPIKFHFIDDTFNKQYDQVRRIRTASVYFSILAVIIAFLGLFGLATFMAQRRTKELGIRKVLGSSGRMAFMLLAADFLKWVSVSLIIGLPIGWFLMSRWQLQFAYKAEIGIWVYVAVALSVFIIALSTVASQSLRASRTNPVNALRYE
jgi:putative ABC transport system permease protein